MPKHLFRAAMTVGVLTFSMLIAPAQADSTSWESLPEETIFAVRVPDGGKFMQTLRANTQLGAVLFSEERLEGVINTFKEHDRESWEEMEAALGRHNLKFEDWSDMIASDFGYAMLLYPRPERDPLQVGLIWATPGEDLATRAVQAIADYIENQESENPATRVDIRLGDYDVMHITIPQMGINHDDLYVEPPDFQNNPTQEQIEDWFRRQEEARQNAKPQVLDYVHVMIVRRGGQLLVAHTQPQSQWEFMAAIREGQEPNIAELTGVDMLTTTFSRFLEAHDGDGAEFTNRVMGAPGVREALPDGELGVEVIFDVERLITMMREEDPESQEFKQLEMLGLGNLGAVVSRLTLDGSVMRISAFMGMPAPRKGIPELLEMNQRQPEPAAWVSGDVLEYMHAIVPLDDLFVMIRDSVLTVYGPEAGQMFDFIEMQAQQSFGTDVATLLNALGDQHTMIRFVPRPPTPEEIAEAEEWGMTAEPAERSAGVWQLADEELMKKVFDFVGEQSGMEKVEEQGFSGYRPPAEFGEEGGVFIGRGYFVYASGSQVVEETLAMLRNPPTGAAALRNHDNFARAGAIMPLKPAFAFSVTDTKRHMNAVGTLLKDNILDSMRGGYYDEAEGGVNPARLADALEKLMPTAEQSEEFFGISAQQFYFSDAGLVAEGVLELPAPK